MDFIYFDSEPVDIHHIFLLKYCEEQSYDKRKWNWIVNKMPIAYRTNRKIAGVAPSKYMKTIEDTNVSATALNANVESHGKKAVILYRGKIMPFMIVRQDITKMQVDAIVNAANTSLIMGGGVCGAIFKAAGAFKLRIACAKVSPIKTGGTTITPGFKLPAKYIIHAAGPIYRQWNAEENEKLLRSAYIESLKLAAKNGCGSIAFPLISSGIYGYPKEEALQVAVAAIKDFLTEHDMDVYLVIFDRASFAVSEKLLSTVESYIDENYVDSHFVYRQEVQNVDYEKIMKPILAEAAPMAVSKGLDDIVDDLDETFNTTLLWLIDAKGKNDLEVYKRANIDRKLFSKICTDKGYMPSKWLVLALAVSLELTLEETNNLLKRAGYALSHSQKFDVIVEFFIVNGRYDIFEINEVLFKYDQSLLGVG